MDRNNIKETLKEIKQSFRLSMNGVAAHSMRAKGADYRLNWGVPYVHLQEQARQYGKDKELAMELWKEDIRECKILATMIMPAEQMSPELVALWMEQTTSVEMAEMLAFHLFQHLEDAPVWAFQWISSDRPVVQVCGYHVLSRLFMKGNAPDERGGQELLDQAVAALQGDNMSVRHAALNCIRHLADLSDVQRGLVCSQGLQEFL